MLSHFPPISTTTGGEGGGGADDSGTFVVPEGDFTGDKSWIHAVYKVSKSGKLPNWEASYQKFAAGQHPQAIAMDQESGKPIQASTVVGHVLEALLHKRPVNLRRLIETGGAGLPNEHEWSRIEEAALQLGMDVANTAQLNLKDTMLAASGRIEKPMDQKTAEDKAIEAAWYDRLRWYVAFKRAGVPVRFGNAAKRQRT
mmetsp:Transcript_48223/g.40819  ORF Transcript_48223/g.40819 Transcript_48223/m.40819 type:complete len:199 (+) Transcript_48223:3-599(+)